MTHATQLIRLELEVEGATCPLRFTPIAAIFFRGTETDILRMSVSVPDTKYDIWGGSYRAGLLH